MLQNFEKKNKEENIGRKKVKMVKNIKKSEKFKQIVAVQEKKKKKE